MYRPIENNLFEGFWDMIDKFQTNTSNITEEKNVEEDSPTSYKVVKEETYKNGQLQNRIERVWENGKLIKDEGETHQLEPQCKCTDNCCSTKNNKCERNMPFITDKEYAEMENRFIKKLQIIEKEVDRLRAKLDESKEIEAELIDENKTLREELMHEKAKLISLRKFLEETV